MKKILAVFDEDYLYAKRLTDYLNQKSRLPFHVVQFTKEEAMKAYANEHKIAVLLISPVFMREKMKQWNIGTVVYLTDMEGVNQLDSCRAVYKYQSAEHVVRELSACYDALSPPGTMKGALKGACRLEGIYAPYGGSRKTTFALLLALILAERYRVLYLNMEGFSGFARLFGRECAYDLSDLLYFGSLNQWKEKKDALIQDYKGMKWIAPVCYPEDRDYLTGERMEKILNELLECGEYDKIVIDIADHFFFSSRILDLCHEIYIPVKEDAISKWKLMEFDDWMERSGRAGMEEKIRRLHLPHVPVLKETENYLEQLMYGEMADYVRRLVKGAQDEELER